MKEETEQKIKEIKRSLCKIKKSDSQIGTGFFCKIGDSIINPFPNLLITSSQVLGQNDIIPGKTINLILSDGQKLDINIDPSYKTYTDINYDITIIQIKNKNIISLPIDKQALDNNNNNINNIYKDKSVYLFDFSDDSKKIYSVGLIQKIDQNYAIESLCFNKRPSLGGPIVSCSNNQLIGIHRGSKNGLNWKNGTFIRGPIETFMPKNNTINMQQANQNMISYQNQNQNQSQFMHNNQQIQIMNNNINYMNNSNYMNNNMNMIQQNQYMSPYPNINNMPNNMGYYNNNNYMNMNNIGINQYNQFQNNNNMNLNNNINGQPNKENNINIQNQINQNIPLEKKEKKDIYEDMYPYIEGDKINIIFKIFEHTEKKVKIPISFSNIELYDAADKIKNPKLNEFTDLNGIKLYLGKEEINKDDSGISLKNEDIIVIKDNPANTNKSINKSKKKLNISFKHGLDEICKIIIPAELNIDNLCMEFFSKNNILEDNKDKFLFKFEGNYIERNSENKLINYKLRNHSTIEIFIKDAKKKYHGKEIKAKIIGEKNNLISSDFIAGSLQKIKDFYEELMGKIKNDKNEKLPYYEKIVISNPSINEVEFKIDNNKLNDERTFLSIGIRDDFTCKVFKLRNLMSYQKKN